MFARNNHLISHLNEERCTRRKTKIICSGGKFKHILNSSEKVLYGGDTKFSYTVCQWIETQTMETDKHIHHKIHGHGGEPMVNVWVLNDKGKKAPVPILVDGYEPKTKTAYQFHGCYWHGHTSLKNRTKRQQKRYKETCQIDWLIKNNGWDTKYNLMSTWECEEPILKKVWFEKEFMPYPHFIVYDFEMILASSYEHPTDDLTYLSRYIPISIAIHEALSKESVYLLDGNPEHLIERFIEALTKKQKAIAVDVLKHHPYPSDFEIPPGEVKEQWKQWVNQVPVIGFNSGKYDLNMMKEYFVKHISYNKDDEYNEVVFAANKENYMFLTTSKFKFLDVKNYIGPGYIAPS